MVGKEKNPNHMYIDPDLLEEISIRLPTKSILKFRTVSKQWRSILESRSFLERRMKLEKHRKILAAYFCDCGDDRPSLLHEEEIVYLHRSAARPSMACDGLVCFPETDWIIIVNPSTGQFVRFPSGLDKESSAFYTLFLNIRGPMTYFPGFREMGFREMGFGRDKVTGSYKVARMWATPVEECECELLDVQTGVWRKLTPPPYRVSVANKSACVNGSIYWLTAVGVLSLNLNTEKFHHVSVPTIWVKHFNYPIVNLDSRLAIAKTNVEPNWQLEIWCMDTDNEQWSKTYSISLAGLTIDPLVPTWFKPLTVSKLGNLVFCDNHKRLFKYHTQSGEIRCLSSDIHVLSPYLENLVPLRSGHYPDLEIRTSRRCRLSPSSGISKFFNRWGFGILDIVSFTTAAIVSHIVFPKNCVILGYLSTRVLSSLLVDLIRDH